MSQEETKAPKKTTGAGAGLYALAAFMLLAWPLALAAQTFWFHQAYEAATLGAIRLGALAPATAETGEAAAPASGLDTFNFAGAFLCALVASLSAFSGAWLALRRTGAMGLAKASLLLGAAHLLGLVFLPPNYLGAEYPPVMGDSIWQALGTNGLAWVLAAGGAAWLFLTYSAGLAEAFGQTTDPMRYLAPKLGASERHVALGREAARAKKRHQFTAFAGAFAAFFGPLILINEWTVGAYSEPFRAVLVDIAIFSIAAMGLNILVGYCGLLNLGFAGFMCIGAYTCAILMKEYGWHYFPACVAAMAHGALWGIILGLPTLHLTGDYFAIVTFGFAELVLLAARNDIFGLTGGARGYPDVPGASLDFSFLAEGWVIETSVTSKANDWFFACFWLLISIFLVHRLATSRLGRSWRAIQADELAAQSCGVNARWSKTLAFAFASALGALAGAIQAVSLRNVAWNNFMFLVSVYVLVYMVLGGMGTISGMVVGSAILVTALELLRALLTDILPGQFETLKDWRFLPDLRYMFYGLILVVFIRFRPEGIVPSSRIARELHPNDLERHHEDVGADAIRSEREAPEPSGA